MIVSRSGHYFVVQQQELGDVNAFVEESVNGQKVIKVFNHEDATQASFDDRNERLYHASASANTYGNVLMPVVGNMGYLLYVLSAIFGGLAASTPSDRSSSASPSSCGRPKRARR